MKMKNSMWWLSVRTKKPPGLRPSGILSLFQFEHCDTDNYSATVVSAAAVSAAAVSTAAVSTATVSSTTSAGFWLLPQDANEIAAIATNIKTNFFIFFAFLNL